VVVQRDCDGHGLRSNASRLKTISVRKRHVMDGATVLGGLWP
jgi:hypothetical protein